MRPDGGELSALAMLSAKQIAKHDHVIMELVARAVEQRRGPFADGILQRLQGLAVRIEFAAVAALEFAPSLGIVAEPFAQSRARRDLLQPEIDGGLLLREPARPETINEDAAAVVIRFRLVDALDHKLHAPEPNKKV